MIKFGDYTNERKKIYNLKWLYILDHPYRILIIRGSGSGETNALLNFLNNQLDVDKMYWHAKDFYDAKYQFLIKKKNTGLKHFNDPNDFNEYSYDIHNVYKDIEEYNLGKKK